MTPQEVIKYLEHHGYISDDVKDMCIEALKKQIPKKPYLKDLFELGTMQGVACPVCDTAFITTGEKYCKHCGQALDWSDEE